MRGFERPTGLGAKTTDLLLETREGRILLEVEMWHDPTGASVDTLASEFRRRVLAKASAKFPKFESDALGVVVELAFMNEMQLEIVRSNKMLLEPIEASAESRWIGQLIIAVQATNASRVALGYEFVDFVGPLRPAPPNP